MGFNTPLFLSKYKIGDLRSTIMSRKEFKLKLLKRFEDALEVRLAGVKAAKAKLEEQINRESNGN